MKFLGWICPACEIGLAPWIKSCPCSKNSEPKNKCNHQFELIEDNGIVTLLNCYKCGIPNPTIKDLTIKGR